MLLTNAMTSIPPTITITRIMAGWYKIECANETYKVNRYDDGMWGVYTDDDGDGDYENCQWVDGRLKDCKSWITNTREI